MPYDTQEPLSAEQRFRHAFERLKANTPRVLQRGTPVTQNNVAREAGCDPSALRKSRFPMLVREIQAYLELNQDAMESGRHIRLKNRQANRTKAEKLKDVIRQRDAAQSTLTSANERIVELSAKVRSLEMRLDEATRNSPRNNRY